MTINYRIRNIVIALALAAAAVLLTVVYVTSAKDDVAAGNEKVTVWVAERDFPTGTAGTKIAGALHKEVVPRKAATPQFVANPAQMNGLLSTQPIYAGEQVSTLRFATPREQGIRTDLKGALRAVQVEGDANQVLAGTLQAGDRVDVVASFKRNGVETDAQSSVVLRNLRVLGTSDNDDGADVTSEQGKHSVVLALTDGQSQRLFLTTQSGSWTFVLRPVKKPKDSSRAVDTVNTVLDGGAR
jgi:Flp pilus assembly protein CpaB